MGGVLPRSSGRRGNGTAINGGGVASHPEGMSSRTAGTVVGIS